MGLEKWGPPIGSFRLEVPQPPRGFEMPINVAQGPAWPPSIDEGNPWRASAETTTRLVDTILNRASQAAPPKLAELFAGLFQKLQAADGKNHDLITATEALRVRIVERLDSQRAERLASVKAEHAAVFTACRDAADRRARLGRDLNQAQSLAQAIQFERLATAKAAVAEAEGRRPPRETYPTSEELAAWWQGVLSAREKLAVQERAYAAQLGVVKDLRDQLAAAEEGLNNLRETEQELAARAEGKGYRNSLGITVEPEPEI